MMLRLLDKLFRPGPNTGVADAADIDVDASGFNRNLAPTDDTLQKVAEKVDALSGLSARTAALGVGIEAADGTTDVAEEQIRSATNDFHFFIAPTPTHRRIRLRVPATRTLRAVYKGAIDLTAQFVVDGTDPRLYHSNRNQTKGIFLVRVQ